MKAVLVLQDGTVFEGQSVGAKGTAFGEAVFATNMTGYQELLTDPSFAGQILALTYPLVGNYGVNEEDVESDKIHAEGFVVSELSATVSNWRASDTLNQYLINNHIVSISGVDTRALARHLRTNGVMMGAISTEKSAAEMLAEINNIQPYSEIDFATRISTKHTYECSIEDSTGARNDSAYNLVVVDFGVTRSILDSLISLGFKVTVVPCDSNSEKILSHKPNGIVFSSGPGNPELLDHTLETITELANKKPLLGIGLGHQLIARAFGGKTFKLKHGHRGANHPVRNIANDRISITTQNHGYAVCPDSLSGSSLEVSLININDDSVEGLKHRELPIYSCQYQETHSPAFPEADYTFKEFVEAVNS